jgi:hypothetical protein
MVEYDHNLLITARWMTKTSYGVDLATIKKRPSVSYIAALF